MLRKLVSAVVVFALATVGLSQASPASAWPDYTTDLSTITNTDAHWWNTTLGKSINSDMVYAYVGQDQQTQTTSFLKSFTVSSTGVIRGPFTVATNSDSKQYSFSSDRNSWLDSNGVFNMLYIESSYGPGASLSSLNHVTSLDGQTWTAPVVLESSNLPVGSACQSEQFSNCGLREFTIATNAAGTAALIYIVGLADGSTKIVYRNKPVGKAWSSSSIINSSPKNLRWPNLTSVGAGWAAAWVYSTTGDSNTLMSSFSTNDKGSSWTAPQLRSTADCLSPQSFLQTAATKFALLYQAGCSSPGATLSSQTFNSSTSRFGTEQLLYTYQGYTWDVPKTNFVAGQSALAISDWSNTNNRAGSAKYILFKNGIGVLQNVNESASQGSTGQQHVSAISLDVLGHLTVVWESSRVETPTLTISSFYRGNRSDVDISLPEMQLGGGIFPGFSADGDVYVIRYWSASIDARVRIRSDAPDLLSDVKVLGTPKSNAILSSKLPLVSPNSIGQRWNFSYQWYSCQYRVTEVLNIATENCAAISGANSATYKVKPTDKGKFLQVRLNVKSDNATQTQYSASTLAVK